MKNLTLEEILIEAGQMLPHARDMSPYNGKQFQCACGNDHQFSTSMASPYTQITHPINHWRPASYKYHPAPANNLARYS